nr:glycoprotein Xg isoform X3 [Equus asinus]
MPHSAGCIDLPGGGPATSLRTHGCRLTVSCNNSEEYCNNLVQLYGGWQVKATSTWRMLWMTPISTRGRNPLITHSLGCPTTAEIFTPHRSHRLARIPAVPTAVEEAAAATTRVMTATEAHTEEGAIDPARVEVVMVEADIPRTAPNMATRWRKSCLPSCRWWWWRWWAQWPLIANATGGGIVSTQTNQRTCEGFRTH